MRPVRRAFRRHAPGAQRPDVHAGQHQQAASDKSEPDRLIVEPGREDHGEYRDQHKVYEARDASHRCRTMT